MDDSRKNSWTLIALLATAACALGCKGPPPTNPGAIAKEPNVLLWGDTHVRTLFSATPDQSDTVRAVDVNTAYDWAKGLPVVNPYTRARVQLRRPLDFLVVTDRAEALDATAWQATVDAAERYYEPCRFTTFVGWEWSSRLGGFDVDRVVVLNASAEQAHELTPFGAVDGPRPEDLWGWMQKESSLRSIDFVAIPSAPNRSGGATYAEVDSAGNAISADYAKMRIRWEPIAEVTQIQGDAEADPELFSDDAFADFETVRLPGAQEAGADARSALLRGLEIGAAVGVNPYQFAMIGSTGSRTGLASTEEDNFWGARPEDGASSAQGLTAVWAEENTRTSIFNAFKRKEVYATTGPRIRVRFFGGWHFSAKQAQRLNMVTTGYTNGYPMGSALSDPPEGKAPSFLMYAVQDPEGASLDRIQMVKGWIDAEGESHAEVYDVAWSPGRDRGPDGEVPPVENLVDLSTARTFSAQGAPSLLGYWSDPKFDPKQPAFYYLRVLQVPTPRHTLYDAVARGVDATEGDQPPTIQERAYTSPIWYSPRAAPSEEHEGDEGNR